jgi:hypothetical protein
MSATDLDALTRVVIRMRRRLWLRELGSGLRTGLLAAALVLATGAALRLGLGWPGVPALAAPAAAALLLPLLPTITRRIGGRPRLADAALAADRAAGAGALLLTAWELATAGRSSADPRRNPAAALVAERAAAALPDWRERLTRAVPGLRSDTLAMPLLAAASALLLLAAMPEPPAGNGRADRGRASAAAAATSLPAGAALEDAIARIAADLARQPSADGDPGSPALASLALSAGDGPTPTTARGTGSSPPTPEPSPAALRTRTDIRLPRRGGMPTGSADPPQAASNPADAAVADADTALPPVPRPVRPAAASAGPDPARRALVARYHAALRTDDRSGDTAAASATPRPRTTP